MDNSEKEIEYLKENKIIDNVEWDFFSNVDFGEFSKDENVVKLQKCLGNKRFQEYFQYVTYKKLKEKKEEKVTEPEIKEYAKITIEFTTERENFTQGTFIMKQPSLVIGSDSKRESDSRFLNLNPFFQKMREETKDFIGKKHCTLLFDKDKKKFLILNHSQNGLLVDLLLVHEEPLEFARKNHEIRLGEIKINPAITSFTYNTINLKIEFLV